MILRTLCKELCRIYKVRLTLCLFQCGLCDICDFLICSTDLGLCFYAFPQPKGEIGGKTWWKQRNPAKPKPSYPHLQLHHPSKACEPEQGPVSHPAVQQSSLAQQLHNLLGTRHPASQAQPSTQLTSRLATRQLSPT